MKIFRHYSKLEHFLKTGKVLVILGPRQVGKTTLLKDYLKNCNLKYKLDNGDNSLTQDVLAHNDFDKIREYTEGYDLIALDEAQRIPNIGLTLKIMVDQIPNIRIIATGSSSFELSGQIGEPLTGRKTTLHLFPVAQIEMLNHKTPFELKTALDDYLIYGSYPEVITADSRQEKQAILRELIGSYLLKDILELERVKSSKSLLNLVRLLAFQVGSEVSWRELAKQLHMDGKTVMRYIDLLEKSYIIFGLTGYSRNLRKELAKKSKYYFYDNGIRNAVIANLNPMETRNDMGQLWENFCISERIKKQHYTNIFSNNYFWRTYDRKEIDLIEEREGNLFAFEFKSGKSHAKAPRDFRQAYPQSEFTTINKENYLDFIT